MFRPGSSRTTTPRSNSCATSSVGSPGGRNVTSVEWPGGVSTSTRSASSSRQRAAVSAARSYRHSGCVPSAATRPASTGKPIQPESNRAAPSFGVNAPDGSYAVCASVAGRRDAQPLRVADVERAGRLGPAQPLLRGDGVEVERLRVDPDRAGGLRAVDEQRQPARLLQMREVEPPAGRPEHVRRREQLRPRRHRGEDRVLVRRRDDDPRAGRVHRPGQAEVLLVGDDDLVLGAEPEPGHDHAAAAGGRIDERDERGIDADHRGELAPGRLPLLRASRRTAAARSVPPAARARPAPSPPRPSRARAGRSCPRSGTRSARARGTARAPPRRSSGASPPRVHGRRRAGRGRGGAPPATSPGRRRAARARGRGRCPGPGAE